MKPGSLLLIFLAYGLVMGITGLAFYGLAGFSQGGTDTLTTPDLQLLSDPYIIQILLFSVKQAGLSALLSVLLAIPLARAIYFLPRLAGRTLFLKLCLLSFVMPTLVLITGLVALSGRSGLLTPWLGEDWNLYGLQGILLAHIYLNMPLAVRVLCQQLNHIPDTSWRLAQQLKFNRWQLFYRVEWPAVQQTVWLLLAFIFVLCFNSFAVVLALGGGPASTTLEVAIYQALKYDFNLSEALTLAWLQFLIAGLIFLVMARIGKVRWLSADTHSQRWQPQWPVWQRHVYSAGYYLSWLVLLLPMIALLPSVMDARVEQISLAVVLDSTLYSLLLASGSAILATLLAWWLLLAVRHAVNVHKPGWRVLFQWLATHTLVAPAMVLSTGLYILLLPLIDLERWGITWLLLLNSVLLLPFVVSQIQPRLLQFDQQYHYLAQNLKLSPVQSVQVIWPFVRPVISSAFSLALLLALGDVAVFSIFGSSERMTLPWLIYSYAGSYRIAEAALVSLLLLALCAILVWLFERSYHRPVKGIVATPRNSTSEYNKQEA